MKPSYVFAYADRSAAQVIRSYHHRLPRFPLDSGPGTGTVYYLTPDFDEPSGGVRAMYRHVDALNAAGIPAAVLHSTPLFRCTWFEHNTRVIDTTVTHPGLRDLLVAPETYAGLLPRLSDQRSHVIFNQGAHLTLLRNHPTAIADHYRRATNLLAVTPVSDQSAELLSRLFPEVEVRRVRLSVDPGLFYPDILPRSESSRICLGETRPTPILSSRWLQAAARLTVGSFGNLRVYRNGKRPTPSGRA